MARITLNIGGIRFETEESTLQAFPRSRLAREIIGDKNLFYDRNPYIFSFILDCYRYGSLHFPHDICSSYLQAELDFWELPVDVVRPCCFKALYGQDDDIQDIENMCKDFPHLKLRSDGKPKSTCLKIWSLVDDATSSKKALVRANTSIIQCRATICPLMAFRWRVDCGRCLLDS